MKKILSVFLVLIFLCSMVAIPTSSLTVTSATIEKAVQWAEKTAADDSHGYSQANRWGNPDYDCASFVISAYRSVGFKLTNAVHCGNMKQAFIDEGFEWIPKSKIDLSTSKYLKRGDILLNTKSHTEIYIGNNMQVGAHEGTIDDYDLNDPGDSTGYEVCPVTYRNSSNWEGILRYPEEQHVNVGKSFYAYITNRTTGKVLTNDDRNVSVRAKTGEANQIWKFERQDDGSYIIRTCYDKKVLNVSYSGTTPGTNVGVYANSDSPAKRWFVYGTQSKCRIKPKCANLALDAHGGKSSSKDGLNVCLWTDDTTATQLFKIEKQNPPQKSNLEFKAGTSTTETSLWWTATLYTNLYHLKIFDENDKIVYEERIKDSTNRQIVLPEGTYTAYVQSKNKFAVAKSNVITFTVKEGEKPIVLGDVDRDGEISVIDATELQLYMAKKVELSSEQIPLSDTDKDGEISVLDATAIQLYMAKIITEF